jgi:excisionase family DNA binding protein
MRTSFYVPSFDWQYPSRGSMALLASEAFDLEAWAAGGTASRNVGSCERNPLAAVGSPACGDDDSSNRDRQTLATRHGVPTVGCGHGDSLMTAKQVAEFLQISVRTVRRWVDRGILVKPIRIGGIARWWKSDVESLLRLKR